MERLEKPNTEIPFRTNQLSNKERQRTNDELYQANVLHTTEHVLARDCNGNLLHVLQISELRREGCEAHCSNLQSEEA